MWENTVPIHNILKEKLQNKIFNQLNIKKVKLTKIILKKKKKKRKRKGKKKRNARWITVVIHSALDVGEQ
jgi:DNA-directed RNA polymerase subunit H (RpoH/RPB5)